MKEIIKGVKNHLIEGETSESERKLNICKECDKSYIDSIFGLRCRECGCILKFKVKSDSSCPINKW